MKHLYSNSRGDLVAADSPAGAEQYDGCDWLQLPDDRQVVLNDHDLGRQVRKTAKSWAAEYCVTSLAGSEDY